MIGPCEPDPGPDGRPGSLRELFDAVADARSAQRALRHCRQPSAVAESSACWDTLVALERYVSALEGRCWPVPHPLLRDLRLHRALCGRPALLPLPPPPEP